MRPAALLALALALLALGGCGGGAGAGSTAIRAAAGGEKSIEDFGSEASGPDRGRILAAFSGYLKAIAQKDYGSACSGLSATVQRSLEQLAGKGSKQDCAALLPRLLSPTAPGIARGQAAGKIAKVRVQGERAFVVFQAPGARLYELPTVREGAEWKAGLLSPSILVPSRSPPTFQRP